MNKDHDIETKLYENLEEHWKENKLVSRVVVFLLVLDLDPMFKVSGGTGGKGTIEHLQRQKQCFYFGFKQCYLLLVQS